MRRTFALWLLLFGVYAATLGLDAVGDSDYGADERQYLLAVESLVDDRDVDVRGVRRARLRGLLPRGARAPGQLTEGRLNEPYGFGFALLLVPAWLLGGDGRRGVCSWRRSRRWPWRSATGWPATWCPTRGRSAPRPRWGSARPSWPTAAPCIRSQRGRRAGRRRAADHPPRRAAGLARGVRLLRAARHAALAGRRSSSPPAW